MLCLHVHADSVIFWYGEQNWNHNTRPKKLNSVLRFLSLLGLSFTFMCQRGFFWSVCFGFGFLSPCHPSSEPRNYLVPLLLFPQVCRCSVTSLPPVRLDSAGMEAGNRPVSTCETQSLFLTCRLSL